MVISDQFKDAQDKGEIFPFLALWPLSITFLYRLTPFAIAGSMAPLRHYIDTLVKLQPYRFLNGLLMSWLLELIFNTASTKRLLLIALLAGVRGFLSVRLPLWVTVAGVVVIGVVVWVLPGKRKDVVRQ